MITQLKSRAEAEKYTYGRHKNPYDPSKCAYEVWEPTGFGRHYQCQRKPGHGPDCLFCKQHDPAAKEKRRKASDERYQRKMNAERPKWYAVAMYALLLESRDGISPAWIIKRDEILKQIGGGA